MIKKIATVDNSDRLIIATELNHKSTTSHKKLSWGDMLIFQHTNKMRDKRDNRRKEISA